MRSSFSLLKVGTPRLSEPLQYAAHSGFEIRFVLGRTFCLRVQRHPVYFDFCAMAITASVIHSS